MKNMKKQLIIIVGSLLLLVSCQGSKQLTSEEILEKSITFHDADNLWSGLNTILKIESQSVFNEYNRDTIQLGFDILNDEFRYENYRTNEAISFKKGVCRSIMSPRKELCESKGWTKNFYTYIWGLPMKLKDKGTKLNTVVVDTVFFETPCHALNVKYEAEDWLYFINKESFKLEGFQFVFNNDASKGEYVRNIGSTDLSGMNVPTQRIWYDLKGKELGTDIVLP